MGRSATAGCRCPRNAPVNRIQKSDHSTRSLSRAIDCRHDSTAAKLIRCCEAPHSYSACERSVIEGAAAKGYACAHLQREARWSRSRSGCPGRRGGRARRQVRSARPTPWLCPHTHTHPPRMASHRPAPRSLLIRRLVVTPHARRRERIRCLDRWHGGTRCTDGSRQLSMRKPGACCPHVARVRLRLLRMHPSPVCAG